MKKRKTIIITFLMVPMICLFLIGCGSIEGTWYHVTEEGDVETLTLKNDQSFITDYDGGASGQWEEVDDNLILSHSLGSRTFTITEKGGKEILSYEEDIFYHDKDVALEATEKLKQERKTKIKEIEAAITKKLVGTWKGTDETISQEYMEIGDPEKFLIEFKENGTYRIISSDTSRPYSQKGETGTFGYTDISSNELRVYLWVKIDGDSANLYRTGKGFSNSEDFDTNNLSLWDIKLKKVD